MLQKNLAVLKVTHGTKNLVISTFNLPKNLGNQSKALSFYKNFLDLQRTLETFNMSFKSSQKLLGLKKSREALLNKANVINTSSLLMLVLNKYYFRNYLFQKLKGVSLNGINFVAVSKVLQLSSVSKNLSNLDSWSNKQKVRKVRGLLKLKLIGLQLSNIFLRNASSHLAVTVTNVLLSKGLARLIAPNRKYEKSDGRYLYYLIFLSTTYGISNALATFLSLGIRKDKNHFRFLRYFIKELENLYQSNHIKVEGLQLRLSGKLGGKMRKSKYHYKLGKVQLQTFRTGLSYSICTSYTKFGVISVKL